ncbi:MAG: DUF4352 domain-containing protein [Ruminococcus sp.]|nr:DUF4352 domain-containing protein [Ruminococcus sp.]
MILGFVSTAVFINIAKDNTNSKSVPVNSSGYSSAPVVNSKATTAPAAEIQATQAPQTQAPATQAPVTEAPEPEYYSVGDSYEANGLTMTVDSCGEYISDNDFLQPDAGNYFLSVHITFTNNSGHDKSVGPGFFKCYVDNKSYDNTYFAGDDYLGYDDLSDGRTSSGTLYYEIPVNANSIELEYTPSYWSTAKRVTFKLK